LAKETKKGIFEFLQKSKKRNFVKIEFFNFSIFEFFDYPPHRKKFFLSVWEPVKGTFSKSGPLRQKGDKN